jgi:hypothetical protein
MKQLEVNVFKHYYEYISYNNWTKTRFAQDVLCNTICYMTTNDALRNAQRPFEKRYTPKPYRINFHKLAFSFVTLNY